MIDKDTIRELTAEAIAQLGKGATEEQVQAVVLNAIHKLESGSGDTSRVIMTAYGKNAPGIVARITHILARNGCDVLDLTQKLLQEFFTIMVLVDVANATAPLSAIQSELRSLGDSGVQVFLHSTDSFAPIE